MDDYVKTVECGRKMDEIWLQLRGEDGMGGIRGQLDKVINWQTGHDGEEKARSELLLSSQSKVNQKQNWSLVLITAIGVILTWLQFFLKH